MATLLAGSLAGAAIAAEAVRTRASDIPATTTSSSRVSAVAAHSEPDVSADEAHAARVAMFRQKVDALREVEGSFWGPAPTVRRARRTDRRATLARTTLPSTHRGPRPDAAPVLLPAEQLRAEVSKSDADCLAQAVYYEARSEPVAGQAAVAQVVMNRVRSPYFPKTVCGVVFQGATHSGCQFSFACDGSMRRGIRDQAAWVRAQEVAGKVLQGGDNAAKLAPALNYHADYVRPKWSRRLARLEQIGRHIFYQAVGNLLPEGGHPAVHQPIAPPAPKPETPFPAWA